MFKIPRQPLAELSQTLGALLIQGSSEVNPIVLDDVETTEFRSFLRMLYPAFSSKAYVSNIIKETTSLMCQAGIVLLTWRNKTTQQMNGSPF